MVGVIDSLDGLVSRRELTVEVYEDLAKKGEYLRGRCAGNVSAAHTYEELDGFVGAFERVLRRAWGE